MLPEFTAGISCAVCFTGTVRGAVLSIPASTALQRECSNLNHAYRAPSCIPQLLQV